MKKFMFIVLLLATSFSMYPQDTDKTTNEGNLKDSKENKKEEPGYHEHDGFYFRFLTNIGFGYIYEYSTQKVNPIEISDSTMIIDYQIGWSLNNQMIFFGGASVYMVPAPLSIFNLLPKAINSSAQRGGSSSDFSSAIGRISMGLNYYLNPQNVYASLAFGFNNNGGQFGNIPQSIGYGLGLQASLGKEWWVSKNWGLGLALNLSYDYFWATRSGYPTITPMHAFAIGLSFSATYN